MERQTTAYYKVMMGGSMYNEYDKKEEALEAAVKWSIGKEVGKDFVPIYRVQIVRTYDEKMGIEILVKRQETTTLAVLVSARSSEKTTGGWVDYES